MSAIQARLFSEIPNITEYADSRIENYPLMGSPLQILAILTFYVLCVFKIGPALMKHRQPMKLDKLILAYNWLQIILNTAVFVVALHDWNKFSIFCSPLDAGYSASAIRIMNLQYSYTMIKVLDLMDTIFFVLRKKKNQVTFLHVYHHIMMVSLTWFVNNFFIGGHVYYIGIANLPVHSVMYFYYFLTAWNPAYKQSIWWKKYITQLQIVQHCFVLTVFTLPFLNSSCPYPKPLLAVYLFNALLMIYLFTKFYVNTYIRKNQKAL